MYYLVNFSWHFYTPNICCVNDSDRTATTQQSKAGANPEEIWQLESLNWHFI